MQEFHMKIFQSFQDLNALPIIEKSVVYVADLPIFFLPVFLVSLWIYYTYSDFFSKGEKQEKKQELICIFYACVFVLILSYTIKFFVDIPRPETALSEAQNLLLHKLPESSFPSDHASISVAFLSALFFTHYRKV